MEYSLTSLVRTGLDKWIVNNKDDAAELFIDAWADLHLPGSSPLDFMPIPHDEAVRDHFLESGYDLTWYELVSGAFYEMVELNLDSIAHSIHDHCTSYLSEQDNSELTIEWVADWQARVLRVFHEAAVGQ